MTTPRQIAKDLERFIEREVRGLAADVTANLAERTPKRTGRAAASWVPSIGGDPADGPPSSVSAAQQEQQRAIGELDGYRLSDGPVYVANGVGYILELDAGDSRQAPSGFVQAAVEKTTRDRAR